MGFRGGQWFFNSAVAADSRCLEFWFRGFRIGRGFIVIQVIQILLIQGIQARDKGDSGGSRSSYTAPFSLHDSICKSIRFNILSLRFQIAPRCTPLASHTFTCIHITSFHTRPHVYALTFLHIHRFTFQMQHAHKFTLPYVYTPTGLPAHVLHTHRLYAPTALHMPTSYHISYTPTVFTRCVGAVRSRVQDIQAHNI